MQNIEKESFDERDSDNDNQNPAEIEGPTHKVSIMAELLCDSPKSPSLASFEDEKFDSYIKPTENSPEESKTPAQD